MSEILTCAEMARADRLTIERGVAGTTLMENAGRTCAEEIVKRFNPGPVAVLCGPGNNGGDGFVIARLLAAVGWPVSVFLLGSRDRLTGDAAHMAGLWDGPVQSLTRDAASSDEASLIVDAIFGAGLTRPVEGVVAQIIESVNASDVPVVAVDVPTGIDGDTGAIRGVALAAELTVTFFRAKPGHLLLPGRLHGGELVVADIGSHIEVLDDIRSHTYWNKPDLWAGAFPWPRTEDHKYARGHALIVSGGADTTGAARLAARGALRVGAGLVTLAGPPEAEAINAGELAALMVASFGDADALSAILEDKRKNSVLIGPGAGVSSATRENVLAALLSGAAVTLDADALTSFEKNPRDLFVAIQGFFAGPVVLTPHEGEFDRLFPEIAGDKLTRARAAAKAAKAVVLLKGCDTVIAASDGRAAINANAPPELATAGAGDVLAGFIAGLMAQGMPPFEAACAGAWLHGEAAAAFGPGLVSTDLPDMLPSVLRDLKEHGM